MDDVKYKIKNGCLEKEEPACTARCPFHLDVREFISRVQRSGFSAAYRLYANATGFPTIVSSLCDAPCKSDCPRNMADDAVSLDMLARAAVRYASNTKPNCYNMPGKTYRVAVVGAGISGLACALRLCNKKYSVTVFEKSGKIGGSLWDKMEPEVFLSDIERQFMFEKYELRLDTKITNIKELLSSFAAVYVATGAEGETFGLTSGKINGIPFASSCEGVFFGGSMLGANAVEAVAQGLNAAVLIDNYIKTGNMKSAEASAPTKIKLAKDAITPITPIAASDGGYTKEEAALEAKRCIKCRCDSCIRHCGLMTYFEKFPKRIEEEVHITINPGTLDGNGTVATRLISTCNQCGLCKEICPEKIDVGLFMRQSHRAMREKNAMPWAFHEFWLRDMEFANSQRAAFCYTPDEARGSKYMFFPGCQLGASNPEYVLKSYRFLLDKLPDTSLLLMCCGAPSVWSGDEELHKQICAEITVAWRAVGEPQVIFACASCRQMFEEFLPEIKGVFLYDLMHKFGAEQPCSGKDKTVSVFDPCASRNYPESQQAVRDLVVKAGYKLQPLPYEAQLAQCCSWGGQISIANPPYTKWLVDKRIHDGDAPYVVYCSNCRDIFAENEKQVTHILDIIFGLDGWDRKPPTFSDRRHNREYLKSVLEGEFLKKKESGYSGKKSRLQISPELAQTMHRVKILDEDIEAVINFCERTQRKVTDQETGHIFGYCEIGRMTYWAEYSVTNSGYLLHNAYSHRMKIELEEVWHGRKQNNDVR